MTPDNPNILKNKYPPLPVKPSPLYNPDNNTSGINKYITGSNHPKNLTGHNYWPENNLQSFLTGRDAPRDDNDPGGRLLTNRTRALTNFLHGWDPRTPLYSANLSGGLNSSQPRYITNSTWNSNYHSAFGTNPTPADKVNKDDYPKIDKPVPNSVPLFLNRNILPPDSVYGADTKLNDNTPAFGDKSYAMKDPIGWQMFNRWRQGRDFGDVAIKPGDSSGYDIRNNRITLDPDEVYKPGNTLAQSMPLVLMHEGSHAGQSPTTNYRSNVGDDSWNFSELTPSLADIPFAMQRAKLTAQAMKAPYTANTNPITFPSGVTIHPEVMRQQAEEHGLMDGRSMAELLTTNAGKAWLLRLLKGPKLDYSFSPLDNGAGSSQPFYDYKKQDDQLKFMQKAISGAQ